MPRKKKKLEQTKDPLFETPLAAKPSVSRSKAKKMINADLKSRDDYPFRILDRHMAETELKAAFEEIKLSDAFDRFKDQAISLYWTATERAPFIEELTFNQLVNMSVVHILDKKSFTEKKLENLLLAIRNCLDKF